MITFESLTRLRSKSNTCQIFCSLNHFQMSCLPPLALLGENSASPCNFQHERESLAESPLPAPNGCNLCTDRQTCIKIRKIIRLRFYELFFPQPKVKFALALFVGAHNVANLCICSCAQDFNQHVFLRACTLQKSQDVKHFSHNKTARHSDTHTYSRHAHTRGHTGIRRCFTRASAD